MFSCVTTSIEYSEGHDGSALTDNLGTYIAVLHPYFLSLHKLRVPVTKGDVFTIWIRRRSVKLRVLYTGLEHHEAGILSAETGVTWANAKLDRLQIVQSGDPEQQSTTIDDFQRQLSLEMRTLQLDNSYWYPFGWDWNPKETTKAGVSFDVVEGTPDYCGRLSKETEVEIWLADRRHSYTPDASLSLQDLLALTAGTQEPQATASDSASITGGQVPNASTAEEIASPHNQETAVKSASPDPFFVCYTISEDRSGSHEEVMSMRLAALAPKRVCQECQRRKYLSPAAQRALKRAEPCLDCGNG